MGVPWNRYCIFGVLAFLGCYIDLVTKRLVFEWRGAPRPGNEWWLWPNYIGIETSLNDGALFGMGSGYTGWFSFLSIIAFFGILYWLFIALAAQELWLTVAMGCITAGIFGNLYDRLGMWAPPWEPDAKIMAVRDWILFQYGEWKWPNFNLADVLLNCGAALLLIHAFFLSAPAVVEKNETPNRV